jgi:hypothetical protein
MINTAPRNPDLALDLFHIRFHGRPATSRDLFEPQSESPVVVWVASQSLTQVKKQFALTVLILFEFSDELIDLEAIRVLTMSMT